MRTCDVKGCGQLAETFSLDLCRDDRNGANLNHKVIDLCKDHMDLFRIVFFQNALLNFFSNPNFTIQTNKEAK